MKRQFLQKLVKMGALHGPTRALFYSFSNGAFNLESIGLVDFLERGNLLIVLSLLPSPSPTSAFSAISTYIDKFLVDLVIKLVLLPTSALLALSIDNGKFSADLVRLVLSIEVSGLANYLSLG